ncbi:hypothetical protein RchiOBHm_Chr3g0477771 [Rosa chinensis]|uniref:Uncharacterized protein n=1 Tax=Rosa chinensis TaxID=74649 RepID=A0A2P6RD20_ROSCH|nr:hypothetical protein RchiOBHm_Chr3g0477771 [Rosa chinensis]
MFINIPSSDHHISLWQREAEKLQVSNFILTSTKWRSLLHKTLNIVFIFNLNYAFIIFYFYNHQLASSGFVY